MTESLLQHHTPWLIDQLAEHGWACLPEAFAPGLIAQLADECQRRAAAGLLSPAGIGRGQTLEVREGIRGDRIDWLEPGQGAACDAYLEDMALLQQAVNRALFMGLADYECHFALYPPGAFYARHLDRFRDDDKRSLSAVLYLNAGWPDDAGGELRLHLDDGRTLDVLPRGGTLVLFLSARLPHEVLPANRQRLSLTGWFRSR